MECVRAAKSFGSSPAVDGVSFAVEQGEIVGFLGPSGSGKTTLLRLIAGFETVSAGEVRIGGRLVSGPSDHVPPERRNVGVVFQEYALFPHLTVLENVEFGLGSLPRPERKRRGQSALELVRLDGMEQRYPHELSGGEQQRVALARTLAPRPVTILLDEPFSNLDAAMKSEMRREVGEILKESGTTAVFVTHDREEAFAMADRVAVLQRGRLEQIDSPSALYHSPATPFVATATGACDFLPGRTQGGRALTDVDSLAVTDPVGALPDGTGVDILVRADDLQLAPDPNGGSVVLSREFRGDEVLLTVSTPSGAEVHCRRHHYSTLPTGTRVRLFPVRSEPFVAFPHQS